LSVTVTITSPLIAGTFRGVTGEPVLNNRRKAP
jgi:hypothetical protein